MSAWLIPAQPEAFSCDPRSTAVVVVDMQNDFGSRGGMFDRAGVPIQGIAAVTPNIARVLEAARAAGLLVVYIKMGFLPDLSNLGPEDAPNRLRHAPFGVGEQVTHDDRTWRILIRGGWGAEVVDALEPEKGDLEVWKHRYSAFFETELHDLLQVHRIRSLIVTGCTTSVCVDSTVRDASFRDYRCLVLADCVAEPIASDAVRTNHEASLLTFEMLFGWTAWTNTFVQAIATEPAGSI